MARTAPVPNIPPIPGMCPSIAVLGGGGDGGSGSGKGAGNGNGQGPGNGNGSGEGAEGDGSGAGNCGQGGAGGCTNCGSQTAAGDPIDVTTGHVFTIPHRDLHFGGPIELVLLRRYHLNSRRLDHGMGFGWTHSFSWCIDKVRDDLVVRPPFAEARKFPVRELDAGSYGDGGWLLWRDRGAELRLDTNDDFYHYFSPSRQNPDHYLLIRVEHRTRNKIELRYDAGDRLTAIIDSAGRTIDVRSDGSGRIGAFSMTDPTSNKTIVFARYLYEKSGDLAYYSDADDVTIRFTYDDEHRLTSYTKGGKITFHFVYDEEGRCVETWGAPADGGVDIALDPALPPLLADGLTKAKGIYHTKLSFDPDGSSGVIDSTRMLGFFKDEATGLITKAVAGDGGVTTRELDVFGMMRRHTDATGATTHYQWDMRGRLLRESDAIGASTTIIRDDAGRVIQNVDPEGGLIDCYRDRFGNVETVVDQKGSTTSYKFDQRSLVTQRTGPTGATTRFKSDAHGNLVETTFPNGDRFEWEFDYFGRLIRRKAPNGYEERYAFSNAGRLLTWDLGTERRVQFSYDSMGRCVSESWPEGTTRFEWGGDRWLALTTQPTGDTRRLLWNRDGQVVKVTNEKGEVTDFSYDNAGYLASYRLFDGSQTNISYDLMGRWTKWSRDRGAIVAERDEVGRAASFEYDGIQTEVFERNRKDEHLAAVTPGASAIFVRDPAGFVTKETQEVYGTPESIDYTLDAANRVVAMKSSLGLDLKIERDASGRSIRMTLPGTGEIELERGVMGLVRRRRLPNGAALAFDYDEYLRRTRDAVERPDGPSIQTDQPEWVGKKPPKGSIERRYGYSGRGDLTAVHGDDGVRSYEYDARQRVVSYARDDRDKEQFRYDPTGNAYEHGEGARSRAYAAGNRLERCGEWTYLWSEGGFLKERRRGTNGSSEVWRYHFGPRRFLDAVDRPDGGRVEFAYDAYGRRLGKTVYARALQSNRKLVSRTRFVWADDVLIHAHEERFDESLVRTRTFLYEDGQAGPFAHVEKTVRKGIEEARTIFYASDILGTPEILLDGAGRVLGRLQRKVFGRTTLSQGATATTPIRFPGQYEDEETGLHYNRYRYYDPDTGRYVSPDPIALNGGMNVYAYCPNPVGFFDALGLAAHTSTASLTTGSGANQQTWVPTPGPHEGTGLRRRGNDDGTHNPGGDLMPGFASTMEHTVPGATCVQPAGVPPVGSGGRGPTSNTNSVNGHSEQNSLEWAERNFTPEQLNNSHMELGGQRPPCPRCHRAMQEFAARHGSTVNYNYPVNNNVTYDGSAPRNSNTTPARAGFTATGQGYHTDLMNMYAASEMAGQAFGDNMVRQQSAVGGMEMYQEGASHDDVHGAYQNASQQQINQGHATPNASGRGAVQNQAHEQHRMGSAGGDPNEDLPPAPGTRYGRGGGVQTY